MVAKELISEFEGVKEKGQGGSGMEWNGGGRIASMIHA